MQQIIRSLCHLFFGRFEAVISRRVSDEEAIAFTFYARRPQQLEQWATELLGQLRNHMRRYNDEVVTAHKHEVGALQTTITDYQTELITVRTALQDAKATLEKQKGKVRHFG